MAGSFLVRAGLASALRKSDARSSIGPRQSSPSRILVCSDITRDSAAPSCAGKSVSTSRTFIMPISLKSLDMYSDLLKGSAKMVVIANARRKTMTRSASYIIKPSRRTGSATKLSLSCSRDNRIGSMRNEMLSRMISGSCSTKSAWTHKSLARRAFQAITRAEPFSDTKRPSSPISTVSLPARSQFLESKSARLSGSASSSEGAVHLPLPRRLKRVKVPLAHLIVTLLTPGSRKIVEQ